MIPRLYIVAALIALFFLSTATATATVDRLLSRRVTSPPHSLSKRGSLPSVPGFQEPELYNISFYHINDVHAHLDEFRPSGASCTDHETQGCVGGYAHVKTAIEKTRPVHKNSLFLNAGDEFQGTLFYSYYKGWKISVVLNMLGFDAMTLGNHEFDDGDKLLGEFAQNLTFPIVSSNVHTENEMLASALVPYLVFPEHRLAILGLTTETTKEISSPDKSTTFHDPLDAANRTVDFIKKNEHVDKIVALTHIGYDKDIELAQKTSGIHLIIGGHSHTLLGNMTGSKGPYPTIETNLDGDEVFVVTSYRWGEYLGFIDVSYDSDGKIVAYEGAPIHLTKAIELDSELEEDIKEWEAPFVKYEKQVLGFNKKLLVHDTCQAVECTLGDFSADAMEAYRNETVVGAIINAGAVRTAIDAGNITRLQAIECFPFGNQVVELSFTGRELWTYFEGIVSRVNQVNGRRVDSFVQVSKSIRFTYNPSNEAGTKLITLEINRKPLVMDQSYRIATLDFLASGGDNFWPPRTDFPILKSFDEVWADYVTSQSPLDVVPDGRISTTTETKPQRAEFDSRLRLQL